MNFKHATLSLPAIAVALLLAVTPAMVLPCLAPIALTHAASQQQAAPAQQAPPQRATAPQESTTVPTGAKPSQPPRQQAAPKQAPDKKTPDAEQELRHMIEESGNDRAALVRNLEDYLKRFPDTPRRVEIYRAIVESAMQLHDSARAMNYAERIVSVDPEDVSITLLAIDLLEHAGNDAGLSRAIDYAGRVLDRVQKSPISAKSPRVSAQEWQENKKRVTMSVYLIRGRLWKEKRNYDAATQDLEASFKLLPNAPAAEKLGEISELRRDFPRAIENYATAFVLPDEYGIPVDRAEARRKLGNVWKQVHGSEAGLGEKVLAAYDQSLAKPAKTIRNKNAKAPLEFELRRVVTEKSAEKVQEQLPTVKLADAKGKVVVLNFWATWCGPCRDVEPIFDQLGRQYEGNANVIFLAASSDEDESRVPPYVQREKIRSTVVFADGLDRHLDISSFPTTIVLDRAGNVVYRSDGFNAQTFEKTLNNAIQRALASGT
ncbi:MAG TPA: TlpA disulfide reductase family protein [Candidatus Dormibacteraeota bacterium]|nr:TlpA disulfide reductase family protein [Candidatus Dormibacteraeota bacterium]